VKSEFTRRQAVKGVGMGIIASLVPKWIYPRDVRSLPNKIVTYLNPETILINRGVSLKIVKAPFNSNANWRLPFRLWTAIGEGQADNKGSSTLGYLIIEKKLSVKSTGKFELSVKQKILQQGSKPAFKDDFHFTEAKIVCNDDDIATPLEWVVRQSMWRANNKLDYCSFEEKGKLENNSEGVVVRISVNNIP
jgi:hypothetical protein